MAVNKVVINTENGAETLIDLTSDTVTATALAEGVTAHDASGEAITGTMATSTVLYTAQTLTDEQKAQARANIGAVSEVDVPVKGVDYWTEVDQESIVQDVIAALGTPVFGRVDENNNIILTGELADGTYTIKYEDADGNAVEVGTIAVGGTAYTNLFDPSTAQINRRLSSTGTEKDQNGTFLTDYLNIGDVMASGGQNILHGYGFRFQQPSGTEIVTYVHYFDVDKTLLGCTDYVDIPGVTDEDGNPYFVLDAQYTTARYVRVTGYVATDTGILIQEDIADIVITLNERIV